MSAEAITGLLVFVATGAMAWATWKMADSATKQVEDRRREIEESRHPAIFMKDLWVETPQEGGARLKFQFKSKGIANLGVFAIAIHYLEVLDSSGNLLANSHPMTVIPAGQAIGRSEGLLFESVRALRAQQLSASQLQSEAAMLRLSFRCGTMPTALWKIELPRKDRERTWLNFRGEHSKAVRVEGEVGRA